MPWLSTSPWKAKYISGAEIGRYLKIYMLYVMNSNLLETAYKKECSRKSEIKIGFTFSFVLFKIIIIFSQDNAN